MKKLIFGIFAHPDDEAFGPSATLMKEVDAGAEVYLICVTKGEGGTNPDGHADLGAVRLREWNDACNLIGAKGHTNLNFTDGSLCNNLYQELAAKVEQEVRQVCEAQVEPFELCLMTYDTNGLTGHLDHIAVSSVATFMFNRLRTQPPKHATIKELAYFCFSEDQMPTPNWGYFLFWPAGRRVEDITRRVDVRDYLERKIEVMKAHGSQRNDAEYFLRLGDDFHAIDNFYVISA